MLAAPGTTSDPGCRSTGSGRSQQRLAAGVRHRPGRVLESVFSSAPGRAPPDGEK